MLITFMSVSTAVIFIIAAWLINYMTRFILEKRSREFAVYLLSGMKKGQIASLYMKENLFLGVCALSMGFVFGSWLRQALFYVFYKSIGKNYKVNAEISAGRITKWSAVVEMIGLTFTFYLFYLGLSAFLMKYINRKGRFIYKKECLFLLRQFSSKTRNTCFVLGTLSLLFIFALVGSSLAFMLSDYQNKQLDVEYPFDMIIISDDTGNDFSKEEALIEDSITPRYMEILRLSKCSKRHGRLAVSEFTVVFGERHRSGNGRGKTCRCLLRLGCVYGRIRL